MSLKKAVMKYPPKKAAEISGVPAEQIIQIAYEMAATRPSMLIYTLGITEHSCGATALCPAPMPNAFGQHGC